MTSNERMISLLCYKLEKMMKSTNYVLYFLSQNSCERCSDKMVQIVKGGGEDQVMVLACVCVCVCVRKRGRERECVSSKSEWSLYVLHLYSCVCFWKHLICIGEFHSGAGFPLSLSFSLSFSLSLSLSLFSLPLSLSFIFYLFTSHSLSHSFVPDTHL